MNEAVKLRWGVSTGTCAAAAAKAAALRLISGVAERLVTVELPSGESMELEVLHLEDGRCGVVKDAGDDLDATDGVLVTAAVEIADFAGPICFRPGAGVGVVTLPGLKISPGEPAINPVPRRMIERALREVIGEAEATVEISIPGGEELARKTFNGRLGIVGGLSILGTSGRVRPMDKNALFESIALELSTHAARGRKAVLLAFARTGEAAARAAWGLPEGRTVQVANEIGFALDESVRLGLQRVVIAGHPGKMLKIACGSFDTHNRTADGRFEALCTHVALTTGSCGPIPALFACKTTEAAMAVLDEHFDSRTRAEIWTSLASRAALRCAERVFDELEAAAAFIDNEGRILGRSGNVDRIIGELMEG